MGLFAPRRVVLEQAAVVLHRRAATRGVHHHALDPGRLECLVSRVDGRGGRDLERFDRVLGSAEAISDAVGGTVTRTSFSTPMIKAAGLARGTSRTIARLRGTPRSPAIGPMTAPRRAPIVATTNLDAIEAAPPARSARQKRSRRA